MLSLSPVFRRNTRLGLHHGPGSFVNLLDQLRMETVFRGIPQINRVPRVRRVIRVIRVRIALKHVTTSMKRQEHACHILNGLPVSILGPFKENTE